MKHRLCCLINPHVMCALCRNSGCTEHSNKYNYHFPLCKKGCEGMWFSMNHEAITDPEALKHYLPGGKFYPPF